MFHIFISFVHCAFLLTRMWAFDDRSLCVISLSIVSLWELCLAHLWHSIEICGRSSSGLSKTFFFQNVLYSEGMCVVCPSWRRLYGNALLFCPAPAHVVFVGSIIYLILTFFLFVSLGSLAVHSLSEHALYILVWLICIGHCTLSSLRKRTSVTRLFIFNIQDGARMQ